MHKLKSRTLGEAWLDLVRQTMEKGNRLAEEGYEVLNVQTAFPAANGPDAVLEQFGDKRIIEEMHKVFFLEGENALGHSYAGKMRGPAGRRDLQDVITLLRAEPFSKRAVVTLCGSGDGEVPCINVIQFLVRDGKVETIYFARGQDAFQKFYADGLCVAAMAERVAAGLGLPAGTVTGFIASSHVYDRDLPAIQQLLVQVSNGKVVEKGGG
jgi:thymidylate synthase